MNIANVEHETRFFYWDNLIGLRYRDNDFRIKSFTSAYAAMAYGAETMMENLNECHGFGVYCNGKRLFPKGGAGSFRNQW
jgi:hypothetical protein